MNEPTPSLPRHTDTSYPKDRLVPRPPSKGTRASQSTRRVTPARQQAHQETIETAGAATAHAARQAERPSPGRSARRSQTSALPDPDPAISIELSAKQVKQIVREATASGGSIAAVLFSVTGDTTATAPLATVPELDQRALSRSLLAGLVVLAAFPRDGGHVGVAEVARRLGTNTSTTHRYVTTLAAVGLLERDPSTRRYRLA